jgi:2'-5' RNA ligase
MLTEQKHYEGAYIGIPFPDNLYLSWAWQTMKIIEYGRFPEMKNGNKQPHITLYYLGEIEESQFQEIDSAVKENLNQLSGKYLETTGLQIIGDSHNQALVLSIKNTDELRKNRHTFEKELPEYLGFNLPFKPHLTITELHTRRSIERARKIVLKSLSKQNYCDHLKIESVQLYYKGQ